MEPTLERIATNASKSKARKEKLHGRDFLVASSTLIVPGVLAGSMGPILYSQEEVSRDPMAWNHMPIVGYHPFENGKHVSARSPDVLNKQQLGFVFKATGGDKLGSELWYDEELTRNFDQQLAEKDKILPRLERGDPIELSTGIFMKARKAPDGAVHNGKSYSAIAEGIVPDHLATLPDMKGACSLDDGCGVGVNAATTEEHKNISSMWERFKTGVERFMKLKGVNDGVQVSNAQLSHDQLRDELSNQLRERFNGRTPMTSAETIGTIEYGYCYVVDVYDKYVLFQIRDKTWKLGYSFDLRTNDVALDKGSPDEVERVVTWKPVTNEEHKMAKRDDTIKLLAANCDCWKGDEKTLTTFSDEKLDLLKLQHEKLTAKPLPTEPAPTPVANAAPIAQPVDQKKLIADLIPSIAEIVANSMKEQGQKQALVNQLTSAIIDPTRKAAREAVLMNEQLAELVERVKDLPPTTNQEPTGFYGLAAGKRPITLNAEDTKDADDILPIVANDDYGAYDNQSKAS